MADLVNVGQRSITEFRNRELLREGIRGVGDDLGMSARVRAFGEVLIIAASGSGSELERRASIPGKPTIDIIFVEEGEFAFFDRGVWSSSRGPLMVAPSGLPQRVRFTGPWRFVLARIPRTQLLSSVPMLSDTVAIHDSLTLPEQSMRAFLAQAVQSEQSVSPGESLTVDRMVLEMAGALLRTRQGDSWHSGTPRAVLRDRALAVIARESGDVRLDPARVAQAVDASLRHLQQVFAEASTSVAAEIRRERSRIARSLLQDPRNDQRSIGQIAAQAGFGSTVSMRRALEEMYGLTPSELRIGRALAAEEGPRPE